MANKYLWQLFVWLKKCDLRFFHHFEKNNRKECHLLAK